MAAELHPDPVTDVQWRVVWFPPDLPSMVFHGSEASVRSKAVSARVAEWNPMVESRTVEIGAWE